MMVYTGPSEAWKLVHQRREGGYRETANFDNSITVCRVGGHEIAKRG